MTSCRVQTTSFIQCENAKMSHLSVSSSHFETSGSMPVVVYDSTKDTAMPTTYNTCTEKARVQNSIVSSFPENRVISDSTTETLADNDDNTTIVTHDHAYTPAQMTTIKIVKATNAESKTEGTNEWWGGGRRIPGYLPHTG